MERLTDYHFDGSGAYMICSGACIDDEFDCNCCPKLEEIVDRLAAYEDTGLEPEDIEGILERGTPLEGGTAELMKKYLSIGTANHFQKLAEAEKDGRLVVLPPNDPLTLRQLREMDGEPVWCARWGVWGLVDIGFAAVITRKGDLDINDEGIHERLYRRKPEEGK